ncbi:thiol reductant ABC exporter subunit CydD [Actinosynnema sp. ALI-1.44]|nr:thiol reductant ABC exporter subunit CydD [Actinosynnema sp. ALI-1.44]
MPASARRALALCFVLGFLSALALVAQAWSLASVVTGGGLLVVLVGSVVVRALLSWATQVVAARAAAGAKEELRAKVLDTSLARGPEWISTQGAASLTVLVTKGLDALDAYFTVYLPALVSAAVVPLSVGAAILLIDWPAAVVIVLTVPLVPLFAILIGKYTASKVSESADATARLSAHLLEMIRALPVLTAFRRAERQAEAVRRVSAQHRRATLATLRVAFSSALALELIATLSVAVVAVIIGVRLVSGDLTLAVGLFVLILAPECYFPLRAAGAAHHASEDGIEAIRRVHALPGEVPVDPQFSDSVVASVTDLRVARRDGFAPDGLSFSLRPGEIVRLSQPSGGGKSTVIAALLGFVSPSSGSVVVGAPDLAAWHRIVAWVPQRPAFAATTVADELRLALSDRNVLPSADEMREVASTVAAEHLIDRKVIELSTGERQRVAIVRALLRVKRGARVLLLDEPTAHLDSATASLVMRAVYSAASDGVAVLLATHRDVALADETPQSTVIVSTSPSAAGKAPRLRITRRELLGALIGALALASGVALTAVSAWLIAKAATQPPILTLMVAIVGVRTFGLARAGLRYLERLVTHDAAFRRAASLRVALWQRLVALGPARTAGLARGEGLRRLVDDVDTVRDLTPRVLVPPIIAGVVCSVAVAVQFALSPVAGVVLACAVLVGGIGAPVLAGFLERRATTVLASGRRRVAADVLTLLEAAPELIVFGAATQRRAELKRIDAALVRQARTQAFGAGAATGLITLATGLAAAFGATTGNPVLALVPLALAEVLALLPPAWQHREALTAAYARTQAAQPETAPARTEHPIPAQAPTANPTATRAPTRSPVSTKTPTHSPPPNPGGVPAPVYRGSSRSEGLLAGCGQPDLTMVPSVRDESGGVAIGVGPGSGPAAVRLAGVDVRWPGAAEPSLRDVTLTIPEGSHVAVVGPSGAGKSTLLALLLGFLPAEKGTAHVPHKVAWCPQEPQLVSTTIRENLRVGAPDASDELLVQALTDAGLAQWGHRLDSLVGMVSGGEAERLALARALVAAPEADIVILDEPTAHLDVPTARTVLTDLAAKLKGRTLVHVTHRPEEAAAADMVVRVDAGRVA